MQRDQSLFSRLSKEIVFNQGNEVRSAKVNPGSSVGNIESEMGGKRDKRQEDLLRDYIDTADE